jgi:hypothetical protein
MKFIKNIARAKIQQLTKKDVVVLWWAVMILLEVTV